MLFIVFGAVFFSSGAGIRQFDVLNVTETADLEGIPLWGELAKTKYGGILEWKKYIGSGHFGSVSLYNFKAPCEGEVIIKQLNTKLDYPLSAIKREIEIQSYSHSNNVVTLYDSILGSSMRPTYLIMEPAYGGALIDAFFNQAGGWFGKTGKIAGWFGGSELRHEVKAKLLAMALVGTLRGLSDLHRAHIIHRDLKPDNIYATESNGDCVESMDCRFLLGDLGAATRIWQIDNTTNAGYTTDLHGTIAYLPPEVKGEHVDGAPVLAKQFWTYTGDVWALGIALHEMLHTKYATFRTNAGANWINGKLRKKLQSKQYLPEEMRQLLWDMTKDNWLERPTADEALKRAEDIVKQEYSLEIPSWGAHWPSCTSCKYCSSGTKCKASEGDSVSCT